MGGLAYFEEDTDVCEPFLANLEMFDICLSERIERLGLGRSRIGFEALISTGVEVLCGVAGVA